MQEEITINTKEIQTILRTYNKIRPSGETDAFLETYKLPKQKQEEREKLNRPITSKEIETVIKNLPTNNGSGLYGFPMESEE